MGAGENTMHGLLDRDTLLQLFDELDKELRFSRTRAQVYVVGGAAISLAFSRERRTMDVDARIDKGHYELTKAVQEIGRRHGLGDTWLNDQATTAIPRQEDAAATTLYASPHLTVTGASPRHLLAMKLLAARNVDYRDTKLLIEHLALETPADAERIYKDLFPEEELKTAAREHIERAFRELRAARTANDSA